MVDERMGDGVKTKLFSWYICTSCSTGKRKTPCVIIFPRGSTQSRNKISPEVLDGYHKRITPLLNCVVNINKKPKWVQIQSKELITMLNSDPLVSPNDKLILVDETTDRTNPIKKQNRFAEIDLIEP
jgi:hypothetical protein